MLKIILGVIDIVLDLEKIIIDLEIQEQLKQN